MHTKRSNLKQKIEKSFRKIILNPKKTTSPKETASLETQYPLIWQHHHKKIPFKNNTQSIKIICILIKSVSNEFKNIVLWINNYQPLIWLLSFAYNGKVQDSFLFDGRSSVANQFLQSRHQELYIFICFGLTCHILSLNSCILLIFNF